MKLKAWQAQNIPQHTITKQVGTREFVGMVSYALLVYGCRIANKVILTFYFIFLHQMGQKLMSSKLKPPVLHKYMLI
jgi:hypothetical protein